MPGNLSRLFLCFLLPQLGCASWPFPGSTPLAQQQQEEPPAQGPSELPPRQAAEVCLATARELEQRGNEGEAIAQYERARQYNPTLKQVAGRLAVLYDRQRNFDRAAEEYQLALQAQPHDADLLNDVGYFYYERSQWAEAEKYLRQAVARAPEHRRAWINLGMVLGEQQHYEESYKAFARAVTPAQARSNVGILLAQHGKYEEARRALRQALDLQPDLRQAEVVLKRLESPPALAEGRHLPS